MLRKVRDFGLALLIVSFYWIYCRLWLIEHVRLPAVAKRANSGQPVVYAHWHGDELLLIGAYWRLRTSMSVMVSRSQDGELLRRVLGWMGFRVVRGSSTRGGAGGLKGLIDEVGTGSNASLAVDGPRGPIYRVKAGILKLAQQTGCPIIPGACAASRRFVFKKAWNQCYLPNPFSKCLIIYGEPIYVSPGASEEDFEMLRKRLEQSLIALKIEAEGMFSRTPSSSLIMAKDGV